MGKERGEGREWGGREAGRETEQAKREMFNF